MKKETINKAILDEEGETEIFCKEKYRGYYIRGTIFDLTDYFCEEGEEKYNASVDYRLAITVLVDASFRATARRQRINKGMFLALDGFTEQEYLEAQRPAFLDYLITGPRAYPPGSDSTKEALGRHMENKTLVIGLDEANIKESEYLNESIRAKKDAILLNMDFVVNGIEIFAPPAKERKYLDRIYATTAFHCPNRSYDSESDFVELFEEVFEISYFRLECGYLQKKEYYAILDSIGELSYEWIEENTMSKRYLNKLNRLNKKIGDRDRMYPLSNFCWKFFDDLIDDLTTRKQIIRCPSCRDFFIYQRRQPTRKFCTPSKDKNCRRTYNNRLDHERHAEERKLKARNYQIKKRAEKKEKDRIEAEKKEEN